MAKAKTVKPSSTKAAIALFITDTHLDEHNGELNESIHRQAILLAQHLGLKCVDHGGDIFNSRRSQPQVNLTAFQEILDVYAQNKIQLHATPGNHDKVDYGSYDSYLDPFQHHPSFVLHRSIDSRQLNDQVTLHYAAFIKDETYVDTLKDHITAIPTKKGCSHILLTHIGVNGAVMNNGKEIVSGISPRLFDPFHAVYVGHYHDPQSIGHIHYFGASLQLNFGEKPDKGALILYDDLSTELVSFDFPKYITQKLSVTDKEVTPQKIKELTKIRSEKDHVRVVLTGKEEDIKAFNSQELKDLGIKVVKEQDPLIQEEIEDAVQVFDHASLEAAFTEFCQRNQLVHEEGVKYLKKII